MPHLLMTSWCHKRVYRFGFTPISPGLHCRPSKLNTHSRVSHCNLAVLTILVNELTVKELFLESILSHKGRHRSGSEKKTKVMLLCKTSAGINKQIKSTKDQHQLLGGKYLLIEYILCYSTKHSSDASHLPSHKCISKQHTSLKLIKLPMDDCP